MSFLKKIFSRPEPAEVVVGSQSIDRRRSPRYRDFQVTQVFFPDRTSTQTTVINLSLSGVRFSSGRLLEHKGIYGLTIRISSGELRTVVRVLWKGQKEGHFVYGAEFVDLTSQETHELQQYIETIKWRDALFQKYEEKGKHSETLEEKLLKPLMKRR